MPTRHSANSEKPLNALHPDFIRQESQRLGDTPELPKRARISKTHQVTVEFNVTVPKETDMLNRSVFLVGKLHQLNNRLSDWDPHGLEMSQAGANRWTIALTGPENTTVEYKYTLGSWDHVEKDAHCGEISNRRISLSPTGAELQIINDHVRAWRAEGQCGL